MDIRHGVSTHRRLKLTLVPDTFDCFTFMHCIDGKMCNYKEFIFKEIKETIESDKRDPRKFNKISLDMSTAAKS